MNNIKVDHDDDDNEPSPYPQTSEEIHRDIIKES